MTRHGWVLIAKVGAAIAVGAGAAWAVFVERSTVKVGFRRLGHAQVSWILIALGAELVSMAAFALLERQLLKATGVRLSVLWLLSRAYAANAIALAIPIVGSGMATAYTYRQYRENGVNSARASVALTLAGVFSTVAFAVVIVLAAVSSGNAAAANGSVVGAIVGVAALTFVIVSLRSPKGRARLKSIGVWCERLGRRVLHRSASDKTDRVPRFIDRVSAVRLNTRYVAFSLLWALTNWATDAAVLVFAIKAVGAPVPWHFVLLVWSAGIAASSFSPTPGGIGVVDIVMTGSLVATGIRPSESLAAVLLYRIVTFKLLTTTTWIIFDSLHPVKAKSSFAVNPPGSIVQLSTGTARESV